MENDTQKSIFEEWLKMRYSELERKLKSQGCYYLVESKKHPMWYSPKTRKTFALSKHRKQEIPSGTLRSILRDSGIE